MIETSLKVELSLEEVCEIAELPTEVLITIVEEGVIEPEGANRKNGVSIAPCSISPSAPRACTAILVSSGPVSPSISI